MGGTAPAGGARSAGRVPGRHAVEGRLRPPPRGGLVRTARPSRTPGAAGIGRVKKRCVPVRVTGGRWQWRLGRVFVIRVRSAPKRLLHTPSVDVLSLRAPAGSPRALCRPRGRRGRERTLTQPGETRPGTPYAPLSPRRPSAARGWRAAETPPVLQRDSFLIVVQTLRCFRHSSH